MVLAAPRVATDRSFTLAEGPFWDPVAQHLLWVDIPAGSVFIGTLADDGTIDVRGEVAIDRYVGAVATATSGEWLVAGKEQLFTRTVAGSVTAGPRLIPAGANRRLNDGKPDPQGRYVVGTMSIAGSSTAEELFLVDGDEVTRLDADLTLSNGIAWTGDGRTMYSVDTERRVVYRRPWPPAGEAPALGREVFLSFDDGSPDGCCVDADDHLWLAMWGLGQVRRYDPSGRLVGVVDVPAPNPSSVAFCGPDLATLVITTAREGLTPDDLDRHPLSGYLFTARPGVIGQPPNLWKGAS